MKLGVFDSGVGGLSVVRAIQRAFPEHEVVFRNDALHVPYGTRPPAEIFGFIVPIFQELETVGCEVIVVACNTVSTTLITRLRKHFTIPLIALEPMVKPAAEQTMSGVIAVCATPTTLASSRYAWLKSTYAASLAVLEPDCSDWSAMIEHNQVDHVAIQQCIVSVLQAGADVIVLGCTHYHWIEEDIRAVAAGRAVVIQPEAAIVRRLRAVLARL